jgi:hypothetical protein
MLFFAHQVSDDPMLLADLEIFHSESHWFSAGQAASNEQRQNRSITFAAQAILTQFLRATFSTDRLSASFRSAPKRFAPTTRPIPAASSGLRRPAPAGSCVSRRTMAKRTLMVDSARFFCSSKNGYRRTTVRLKARHGSKQYQPMNPSMA